MTTNSNLAQKRASTGVCLVGLISAEQVDARDAGRLATLPVNRDTLPLAKAQAFAIGARDLRRSAAQHLIQVRHTEEWS